MALYIGNQKVAPSIVTIPLSIPLDMTTSGGGSSQLELIGDLGVSKGYCRYETGDGTIFYIKIYTGMTIGDLVTLCNSKYANSAAFDTATCILNLYQDCNFMGLTQDMVTALINQGTIQESDPSYQVPTNLVTLYGLPPYNKGLDFSSAITPITKTLVKQPSSFDWVCPSNDIGNYVLYYAFYNSGIHSIDFSNLFALTGYYAMAYAFAYTNIQTLSFPALKSNAFGSNTNQFDNMLYGVTGCTVHFPSNLQSVIGSWASVTGGFGGTNTTVLFDLTATN